VVRFYLAKKMSSVASMLDRIMLSMLDRLISTAQNEGTLLQRTIVITLLVKILFVYDSIKLKEREIEERERERETCRFRKINVENEIKYEIYTIFKYIFTYVTIWIFFRLSKD